MKKVWERVPAPQHPCSYVPSNNEQIKTRWKLPRWKEATRCFFVLFYLKQGGKYWKFDLKWKSTKTCFLHYSGCRPDSTFTPRYGAGRSRYRSAAISMAAFYGGGPDLHLFSAVRCKSFSGRQKDGQQLPQLSVVPGKKGSFLFRYNAKIVKSFTGEE